MEFVNTYLLLGKVFVFCCTIAHLCASLLLCLSTIVIKQIIIALLLMLGIDCSEIGLWMMGTVCTSITILYQFLLLCLL